ncbi:MAG: hypothetical protein K6A92_09015, partial [Lachnospiraceae bacterium]|nr:hypothetical protein [Lachnospiraceae bacterium]
MNNSRNDMKTDPNKISFILRRVAAALLIIAIVTLAFLGRILYLKYQQKSLIETAKENRSDAGMLVLGDSIWDLNRGDNGIADL